MSAVHETRIYRLAVTDESCGELSAALNQAAADGWELVSVAPLTAPMVLVMLRRPAPVEAARADARQVPLFEAQS